MVDDIGGIRADRGGRRTTHENNDHEKWEAHSRARLRKGARHAPWRHRYFRHLHHCHWA